MAPSGESSTAPRNGNLDICRAAAILMVLVHHGVQMSPIRSEGVHVAANLGKYGVDLFFVLSGWLIGRLYWSEKARFGNVQIGGFLARRWLRTVPPYAAVLLASSIAVGLARGEPFDTAFLVFLQNYEEKIPYFLVSWSLCVEEHFYLVAPLALAPLTFAGWRRRWGAAAAIGVLLPAIFRAIEYVPGPVAFGYAETATHLRFEGLYLGFLLAYMPQHAGCDFDRLSRMAPFLACVALMCFSLAKFTGGQVDYVMTPLAAAVFFGAVILAAVNGPSLDPRFTRICRPVAYTSYSIYLAHPLALHVARGAVERVSPGSVLLYVLAAIAATMVLTAAVYVLTERTALTLRDRLAPRRASASSPAMAPPVATA